MSVNKVFSSQKPLFGPVARGAADLVSGFSSTVCNGISTLDWYLGPHNPAAMATLGITSAFSIVSGPIDISQGSNEWKTAKKVNDVWGRANAGLKCAGGVLQTTVGAAYISIRGLTIASYFNSDRKSVV